MHLARSPHVVQARRRVPVPAPPRPLQVVKAKATPAAARPGKQQQQSVIDSKRAYNISILMGSKIKIPVRGAAPLMMMSSPALTVMA